MRKTIIFLGLAALAGSIVAQPNGSSNNSNFSNVFLNVIVSNNNNDNVNINVQQAVNVNKAKPKPNTVVAQTRRRTTSVTTPKPANAVAHSTVRRPSRPRRTTQQASSTPVSTTPIVVQNNPVQAPNQDNVSVSNVIANQEFSEQMSQQQMLGNNFNPVQTNEQNVNEEKESDNKNDNQGISINLPTFKKPQIYFSYADLSVTHKSISLKTRINQKMLKVLRKHKAKHGGRIKRYITHNCCKWN